MGNPNTLTNNLESFYTRSHPTDALRDKSTRRLELPRRLAPVSYELIVWQRHGCLAHVVRSALRRSSVNNICKRCCVTGLWKHKKRNCSWASWSILDSKSSKTTKTTGWIGLNDALIDSDIGGRLMFIKQNALPILGTYSKAHYPMMAASGTGSL